jgi:hypothetical protein
MPAAGGGAAASAAAAAEASGRTAAGREGRLPDGESASAAAVATGAYSGSWRCDAPRKLEKYLDLRVAPHVLPITHKAAGATRGITLASSNSSDGA